MARTTSAARVPVRCRLSLLQFVTDAYEIRSCKRKSVIVLAWVCQGGGWGEWSLQATVSESDRLVGVDGSQLEGLLGFNLRVANAVLTRDFLRQLKVLGLTQKSFATLTLIRANPGVAQVELARYLKIDRATMTATVDRLRTENFVELRDSEHDRRRRDLHLTADGEAIWLAARRRVVEHERKFVDLFTSAGLDAFMEGLRRISNEGEHRSTPSYQTAVDSDV